MRHELARGRCPSRRSRRSSQLALAQRRLGRISAVKGDGRGDRGAVGCRRRVRGVEEPADAAGDRWLRRISFSSRAATAPRSNSAARRRGGARAGRLDLRSRALPREGVVLAKRGEFESGMEMVKEGLSLALEHGLTTEAVDAYQRLGTCFETAGDYAARRGRWKARSTLPDLWRDRVPKPGASHAWPTSCASSANGPRAVEIVRDLLAENEGNGVRTIADGTLGSSVPFGASSAGSPPPTAGLRLARRLDVFSMQVDCAASLAVVADYDGDGDEAVERSRFILNRWEESEDHHYAIWGLRSAAARCSRPTGTSMTRMRAPRHSRGSRPTRGTPTPSLRSPTHSARSRSAKGLPMWPPSNSAVRSSFTVRYGFQRSGCRFFIVPASLLRGGGLSASSAIERQARRPTGWLRRLGTPGHWPAVRQRRSRISASRSSSGSGTSANGGAGVLSQARARGNPPGCRRAHESGEIAAELFLSSRTIDMHVRNILAKLDCRSRVEASIKAGEAGLLRA